MSTQTAATTRPLRRLLRWTRNSALVLGAVFGMLFLSHALWLPGLVYKLAASQGLEVHYEDLDLAPFGGALTLTGVEIGPLPKLDGEQQSDAQALPLLARLDFLTLDLDVSALFRGKLRVHRVELDGIDAWLTRDAAGAWNFDHLLPAAPASERDSADADTPTEEDPMAPAAWDLRVPVQVDALRLQGLRVHLSDALADPPLDTRFDLNLALSDLGVEGRPARLVLSADAPQLLDGLRVDGEIHSSEGVLEARLGVDVFGLHLQRLTHLLEPLGIKPIAHEHAFGLQWQLNLAVLEDDPQALSGEWLLHDLELRADQEPALTLAELRVPLERFGPEEIRLGAALLRGLEGSAARKKDGTLRVAGVDFLTPTSETAQAKEVSEPTGLDSGTAPAASDPLAFALAQVRITDSRLRWHDAAVHPPASLELGLDATLLDLALGSAPSFDVELALPGVWKRFKLSGKCSSPLTTGSNPQGLQLELDVQGLAPDALEPYLAAAGLRSDLQDGNLQTSVRIDWTRRDQGLRLSATLRDLRLADGEPLLSLGELQLLNLQLAPGKNHIEALTLSGCRLELAKDARGQFHVAGLVTAPPLTKASPGASTATPDSQPAAAGPQTAVPEFPAQLVLESLRWTDTVLHYRDYTTAEPLDLVLDDMGLELDRLDLFGDPERPTPAPAKLRAWFRAAGLTESLELSGKLTTRPGPLDLLAELSVKGRGIETSAIAPLLAQAGLESELTAATLDLQLMAHARSLPGSFALEASLTQLAFADEGRELLALDLLAIQGLRANDDGLLIESLLIEGPRLRAERDPASGLHFLGLRLLPRTPAPSEKAADRQPAKQQVAAPALSASPLALRVGQISLQGLRLDWKDSGVEPMVESALTGSLLLAQVDTRPGMPPAKLEAQFEVEGALQTLRLQGELESNPEAARLTLELGLEGLNAGSLRGYLPPGLSFASGETAFDAKLLAEFGEAEAGRSRGRLSLSDVALRAGPEAPADFTLAHLELEAARLDSAADHFEFSRVNLAGLELKLERTGARRFEFAGLVYDAPEAPEGSASLAAEKASALIAPEPAAQESALNLDLEQLAAAEEAPTSDVKASLANTQRWKTPTVVLAPLDLGPMRFSYVDHFHPESAPLRGSFTISTDREQVLIAPDPEDLEPLELRLHAELLPLVEQLRVDIVASPWAADPGLAMDLAVRGIRGERLEDVLPELAQVLRMDDLPNGSFDAHAEVSLKVRRRGPADLGLDRDFGADFILAEVALRPTPEGQALAGLESLEVSARRISLATGDVHMTHVEVLGPFITAVQDAAGLHVAGLLIPPAPESLEAGPVDGPAEGSETEVADAAETAPSPDEPQGEIRIDNLLISGLRTSWTDETTSPRTYLPIKDLELELRGLSSLATTEPRPLRLRGIIDAGLVELPERSGADSLLSGLLSAATDLVAGEQEYVSEERLLFDQFELNGRLTLAPVPKGFLRVNLLGLELPAFHGLAAGSGVDIGDGLMDSEVTLRFLGEDGLGLESKTQFDYLSLSEPADGPISRYLKLPAPLDTVLFLLKDADGRQTIPVNLRVPIEGVSPSAVAGAAVTIIGQLIGDALAGSALRFGTSLTDLVGLTGAPDPVTAETSFVEFNAGAIMPEGGLQAALQPVFDELRADPKLQLVVQHELGPGDLQIAARLTAPEPQALLQLLERLRIRKAHLLRERSLAAARTRAQYLVGAKALAEAEATNLRRLDRELDITEAGLDELLEWMRPGAERRVSRRARAASRALAQARLDRIQDLLLRSGIRDIHERLDVRRARPTDVLIAADGEPAIAAERGGRISLTPRPRPE